MSKTFRVYRQLTETQYKDVFAVNEAEALEQVTQPVDQTWITTDKNHITDKLVILPNYPIQGAELFIERDIQDLMEQPNE